MERQIISTLLFLTFLTLSNQLLFFHPISHSNSSRRNIILPQPSCPILNRLLPTDKKPPPPPQCNQELLESHIKFDPSRHRRWIKYQKYSNSRVFRNQTISRLIKDFSTLIQNISNTTLNKVAASDSSLLCAFAARANTLHFNMWCHKQLIQSSHKAQFYATYLLPQFKKFIETIESLKQHILSLDRHQSLLVVIQGDQNILTMYGMADPDDFTSIAGRNIQINGLGNIVSGEDISLEGEGSFVLGRNIAYKGSDGIVITNNKDVLGDRKLVLDRFLVDIDTYEDGRSGNPLFIEDDKSESS